MTQEKINEVGAKLSTTVALVTFFVVFILAYAYV